MTDSTKPYLILFFSGFIISVLIYLLKIQPIYMNSDVSADNFISIFTMFTVLALITERLVEVLISASRKPDRLKLERLISRSAININEESSLLIEQKEIELSMYKAETEKIAMKLSLFIGVSMSLIGVKILGELMDYSELSGIQNVLFMTIDTLVSGGLIAGGAKGMNKLTSALTSLLNSSKGGGI